MAFGKNKLNPNLRLFTFKIRSRDNNKNEVPVYLEVSEKIDGKYVVQPEPAYFVNGTLTGLEHDERIWNGGKGDVLLQNAKAYLRDGDNLYILTIPYNILGRSVLNALVNLKTYTNVEISVYMSKGDKSYPQANVRQDDKRVDWKYAIADIPKAKKIPTSKGVISDFGEVDAFFINEVKTFGAVIAANRQKTPASTEATAPVVESQPSVPEDESVPF